MGSVQDIVDVINALSGSDPLYLVVGAAVVAIFTVSVLYRSPLSHWYKSIACFAVFLAAVAFVAFKVTIYAVFIVALALLFVCLLVVLINYFYCNRQLENILKYSDSQNDGCDYAKAIAEIKNINTGHLTKRQLIQFKRYQIHCHLTLGNAAIVKKLLEDDSLEPALRHLVLHVIAVGACDRKASEEELKTALACASEKTEPLIRLQLDYNLAVAHINAGHFRSADDELGKVIASVHRFKISDKTFLNLLYTTAVLNKARVGCSDSGITAGQKLISDYQSFLDMNASADISALFNLKLMLMRQYDFNGAEKASMYAEEVESVLGRDDLSRQQLLLTMASFARIAYSDGLDPTPALSFFSEQDLIFADLKPGQRFVIYRALDEVLRSFVTEEPYITVLHSAAKSYFLHRAADDLSAWEKSLPQEAILLRAQVLRERSWLYEQLGFGSDEVLSCARDAIGLLEEGLQIRSALELRWMLAKRLIFEDPAAAKAEIDNVAHRLQTLEGDPSLGYPYYELCLCYGLLGMARECREAYEKAASFDTS